MGLSDRGFLFRFRRLSYAWQLAFIDEPLALLCWPCCGRGLADVSARPARMAMIGVNMSNAQQFDFN